MNNFINPRYKALIKNLSQKCTQCMLQNIIFEYEHREKIILVCK